MWIGIDVFIRKFIKSIEISVNIQKFTKWIETSVNIETLQIGLNSV